MSSNESPRATTTSAASRWRMVSVLLIVVGAAHFNRVSISVAGAEHIIPDQGIDPTAMGWVYSAYLFLYTLSMSPGGWFIDRFGPRLSLFVVGIGSAFFVMLTGLAGQFWSGTTLLLALLAVRGLMGVVNAPTHPGAARLVGDWIPSGQRSMVNGMVNMAACVGISVTYLAFGILMDHYDWPGACFIAAGVTALIALAWALIAVDAPRKLPAAETPLLERPIRRPGSLLSRSLILLTLSYGALGYFQYLIFYWAQYYFENERALGKDQSRLYASILTLTMGLGMLAGGWLSDRLRSGIRHPRNVAIVPFAGFCGAATMLYVGFIQPDPLATLIFFCLATASIGSCEGAFWTLAVEIGGSRGGLAAGILNTGGNAGGMIAPVLTPMISTAFGWQAGLGVASLVCLVGAACWIGIDPRERLEE